MVTLLLVLQSILGQYTGMVSDIWIWAALVLFPGWFLLLLSQWWNKFPARLVAVTTANGMTWLSVGYLLLLLLTILLSQMAINDRAWSLQRYFQYSYWWLWPFNALLIAGMLLLFYRKEVQKIPDAGVLKALAEKQAAKAADQGHLVRQQCLELLAEAQIPAALALLHEQFNSKEPEYNQVIVLQSQATLLRRNQDLNLIEPKEAQRQLNRLTMAVLNLAEQL
ncbi:MAG: hypothetical protein DA408_18455 [Bacteroidetes bacterium]|nr:MAG: hypothetical protein C7N36_21625 [Bacteroidota bacterium]PTM09408.1 MAG: hypothetical protein DA408_18455 [Bacteroidota bacterium]